MPNNKLITLKDASGISGYSPDYIGQLIRSGKLKGEKVYCQVTWMTTAEDVLSYKNKLSKESQKESISSKFLNSISSYKNRIESEIRFLKIFLQNIKTVLPILLIFLSCFIFLCFFVLDNIFNTRNLYTNTASADSNLVDTNKNLAY